MPPLPVPQKLVLKSTNEVFDVPLNPGVKPLMTAVFGPAPPLLSISPNVLVITNAKSSPLFNWNWSTKTLVWTLLTFMVSAPPVSQIWSAVAPR